jgi:nitroimidazol reductase NimA-like FMN-containing flavoprotein (pyridoxamine 5'-phosphate oxidase superfamily)
VIPVSFGYDGEAVYIHTASAGKKIDYIGENPHVCLSFVQRANLISDPDKACDWSYDFTSAIAEGIITEIIDADGKTRAINQIMSHYSGREWDIPEKSLAGTRVWKITLYKLNGKRSPPP